MRAARFTLHTPAGEADVELALPGLYNVYNALAAAALATALEVPLATIVAGPAGRRAAFGRAESVDVSLPAQSAEPTPAGASCGSCSSRTRPAPTRCCARSRSSPASTTCSGVLNDQIADGRDVSWIWDADFELLAGRIRSVTCSGTRAAELAMRLKYAGRRARAHPRPERSAGGAARGRRRVDLPTPLPPLYALPTYTAMLALRELLIERGEASSAWT